MELGPYWTKAFILADKSLTHTFNIGGDLHKLDHFPGDSRR
jgi:hypothetical protein